MKHLFLLAALAGTFSLAAAPMETVFKAEDGDKLPKSWRVNQWSGYKPFAPIAWDAKEKALHIGPVTAPSGFGYCQQQYAKAVKGDKVRFTLTAKGSGKFWAGLQNFIGQGKWVGVPAPVRFAVTDQFTTQTVEVPVIDLKGEPTNQVMFSFGGDKGAELWIKSISCEVVPAAK